MSKRKFLTTRWSHLAMLNYEVDPAILRSRVPTGTELDVFDGRVFVSMVGFLYHDTRVLGVPVPLHRRFAEVNLRYYVRYRAPDGWRRGVAFVKEIVPRQAVAWVARTLYDEPFVRLPMKYSITPRDSQRDSPGRVEYQWKFAGNWQRLCVETMGDAMPVDVESEEEFITEHYWGYTPRKDGSTSEYEVEHPPWRVWQVKETQFDCDIYGLYGPVFAEPLAAKPSSAFLADGSDVVVYCGNSLA